MREPCFDNLLTVLKRQVPARPTLFELFLNIPLYERAVGRKFELRSGEQESGNFPFFIEAFAKLGYDYVTLHGSDFSFPAGEIHSKKSRSLNEGSIIHNRESFEKYPWPDPDKFDYSRLERCEKYLPGGMKVLVWGNMGVFENVTKLVGFENLCYMIADDPELVTDIFEAVGSRFVRYYEICAAYSTVGALVSNDDWGHKTQTMLSTKDMREYVIPWHKKIVEKIHAAGKPAILHSCGKLDSVMDDIIDNIKYDAKHSFEDTIEPVEEAYKRWGGRITILGGIDLDFVCRAKPEEIKARSRSMLEITASCGGYALGSGNSIPDYVPDENYYAMTSAVFEGQTV